jgi:hypothetical protein
MEPWTWIVVYLVGFTLFQLLLFRYVSDGQALGGVSLESGETAGPQSVERGRMQPDTAASSTTEGQVRCPHCGVANDDDGAFTYCRNCLAQLQ